jgi:hypothetical protein
MNSRKEIFLRFGELTFAVFFNSEMFRVLRIRRELALDPIESLLDAMLSLEGDEEPLCPFL